jgi:osmoprotectant transport system ATP-binding protein
MISFEGVTAAFNGIPALKSIDLHVPGGSLCVLVGPSGSGKSTLLRLVNRLVEPTSGTVRVRGMDVADLNPVRLRRSIGYVIQAIGLFPHRTVAENIATVPKLLGWPKARIDARVGEMLSLVQLVPAQMRDRLPSELSGGQAQRIGLARALAADPDLLLMDEPFGAVDPITRRSLRSELKRIHAHTGKTIVFVTHDPAEALELATQLVVLREGRIVASGAPAAVTGPDVDPFVRDLIGGPDLVMRRLDWVRVRDVMQPPCDGSGGAIAGSATLSQALARLIELRCQILHVLSDAGTVIGSISLQAIAEHHP